MFRNDQNKRKRELRFFSKNVGANDLLTPFFVIIRVQAFFLYIYFFAFKIFKENNYEYNMYIYINVVFFYILCRKTAVINDLFIFSVVCFI